MAAPGAGAAPAPAASPRCPECGYGPGSGEVALPALVRWRRWIRLGVLVLAVGVVTWLNWQAWPGAAGARAAGIPAGVRHGLFPPVPVGRADLEAIRAGAKRGALLDWLWGDEEPLVAEESELVVALQSPAGNVTQSRYIGWPLPIVDYTWWMTHENVYTSPPPHLVAWRDRDGMWFGLTHVRTRVDQGTTNTEHRAIQLQNLAGAAVVVLAVWWAGGLARVLLLALFGRKMRRSSFARVGARVVPFVLAGSALAGVVALSMRVDDESPRYFTQTPLPDRPTGLTLTEVKALRAMDGGEARVAAAMLAALEPDADGVLVVGWDDPAAVSYWLNESDGAWPLIFAMYGRSEHPGRHLAREGVYVEWTRGWLLIGRQMREPVTTYIGYTIDLGRVSTIVIALWVVWLAAALPSLAARRWHWRRLRRRGRCGLCVRCGYELRGLAGEGFAAGGEQREHGLAGEKRSREGGE